jgi:hypothetical protein
MADIIAEQTHLQGTVSCTEAELAQAKIFAAKKKKPEIGKAFGQPINARMDEVLEKHGIDRAAMFGGTIEENGTRILMAELVCFRRGNRAYSRTKYHISTQRGGFVSTVGQQPCLCWNWTCPISPL